MEIELLDISGAVVGRLSVPEAKEAPKHYPRYPGAISFRKVSEQDLQKEAAAIEERRNAEKEHGDILRAIKNILLDFESRLRALEKREPIAPEKYKPATETIKGMK